MSTEQLQQLDYKLHVWLVEPEQIHDPVKLAAYAELLSPEERKRQQRFHFKKDRHSYLVSHALVRTVLSKYAPIDPADWQFSSGVHGRPEIVTGSGVPSLHFNLSHTNGLAVCVVCGDTACGVDAEKVVARGNLQAIAARMFAPAEIEDLNRRTGTDYLDGFFTYWTLREAFYKALGTGLAMSDNNVTFVTHGAGLYQLDTPSASHGDTVKDWYFEVQRPTPEHIVSIAVQSSPGNRYTVVTDFIIP